MTGKGTIAAHRTAHSWTPRGTESREEIGSAAGRGSGKPGPDHGDRPIDSSSTGRIVCTAGHSVPAFSPQRSPDRPIERFAILPANGTSLPHPRPSPSFASFTGEGLWSLRFDFLWRTSLNFTSGPAARSSPSFAQHPFRRRRLGSGRSRADPAREPGTLSAVARDALEAGPGRPQDPGCQRGS